jgi:hypothetical protein
MTDPAVPPLTSALLSGAVAAAILGLAVKAVSDWRATHLSRVRLINALLHEAKTTIDSWKQNHNLFKEGYGDGTLNSDFGKRIIEHVGLNKPYFPYIVSNRSTTSIFTHEDSTIKEFLFLESDTLKSLTDFHDEAMLLDRAVEELKGDAFQHLLPERKMRAIGNIVETYDIAERLYHGDKSANGERIRGLKELLDNEHKNYTGTSFAWLVLLPDYSKTWWFHILLLWTIGNLIMTYWNSIKSVT